MLLHGLLCVWGEGGRLFIACKMSELSRIFCRIDRPGKKKKNKKKRKKCGAVQEIHMHDFVKKNAELLFL